ncbi:MAG: hypothetical protein AABY27_05685, partial [Pseudomonadota bacterium]
NKIEWNWSNSDGSSTNGRTYKYDYDSTGNWIKRTKFEGGIAKNITEREIIYYKSLLSDKSK